MNFFPEQSSWNGSIKGKRRKENFDKKILKNKKFDKIKNLWNFFGTKFLEWINKKKENFTRKFWKAKNIPKSLWQTFVIKLWKKVFEKEKCLEDKNSRSKFVIFFEKNL